MNKNLIYIKGSLSIEYMQKAIKLKKEKKDFIDMAGGEPDFDTPKRIRHAAKQALDEGYTHYAVGPGIEELRHKIAKKLELENGIVCNSNEIILTPGAKFGIHMAINSILNPGDEVIVFSPGWVSYEPIIQSCGGKCIKVELDFDNHYRLDKRKIEDKITERTKAIIINYPNNPTGNILTRDEAEILVDIVEKYNIIIISDEVYEKIVYDNKKNISMASYTSIRDKIITVNGFSKAYAMTGWRLGYIVAAEEVTNIMYKYYVHTITGISTFIQLAAIHAFECEEDVTCMIKEYERRRNYFVNELNKIKGITCWMPEGAFYVWVKFDSNKNSYKIVEELMEQVEIVGVPGEAYGEKRYVCVRFSFACNMQILENAINRLKTWAKNN